MRIKFTGIEVKLIWVIVLVSILAGCRTTGGNVGKLQSYPFPFVEEQWIRNGEPLEFEGQLWYPQDGFDSLQDSEVYLLGEYRGIQYFIDKVDVRPFTRLYTKFDRNKFRFYTRREEE